MELSERYSNMLVFFCLLIGSGVFSHILTAQYSIDGGRVQVALSAKLILALSYTLAIGIIIYHRQELKRKFTVMVWMWVIVVVWSFISMLFGQFNFSNIARFVGFLGSTLVGLMLFVSSKNSSQVIKLLFGVCISILLINLIFINWQELTDYTSVNIKGVFFQKNLLGSITFLSIYIASFCFFLRNIHYRIYSALTILIAGWLLFLSTSMTSSLLIPIGTAAVFSSFIISRSNKGVLIVFSSFVIIGFILCLNWNEILDCIGKNSTFSGRTIIWREYWALLLERPWIGHGYGAYPEKLTSWIKLMGPHNGYIELIYYIGFVGLFLMLFIIGSAIKSWCRIIKEKTLVTEASFLFGFIVVFLALNITETYMLNRSGLYWPLFIYVTLQLSYLSSRKVS